jgi:hypothetical protein
MLPIEAGCVLGCINVNRCCMCVGVMMYGGVQTLPLSLCMGVVVGAMEVCGGE